MKKITPNIANLIERAEAAGLTVRPITQKRGGYRKHHPLGSNYVPRRVVMIDGKSFSHGGAKQFLTARGV